MKKWFFGKRVFPRWKLILLVLIGVYAGFMLDKDPTFAIIWALLMIWEITKKDLTVKRYGLALLGLILFSSGLCVFGEALISKYENNNWFLLVPYH